MSSHYWKIVFLNKKAPTLFFSYQDLVNLLVCVFVYMHMYVEKYFSKSVCVLAFNICVAINTAQAGTQSLALQRNILPKGASMAVFSTKQPDLFLSYSSSFFFLFLLLFPKHTHLNIVFFFLVFIFI